MKVRLGFIRLSTEHNVGFCEHCDKSWGPINGEAFLDYLGWAYEESLYTGSWFGCFAKCRQNLQGLYCFQFGPFALYHSSIFVDCTVCPKSSGTQRLKFCLLANMPVSPPCFTLKSVGNPVELFRSMCRWQDQLVALGKRVASRLLESEFNTRSQNCCAGSVLSVSLLWEACGDMAVQIS
jgi:hypothetical protein